MSPDLLPPIAELRRIAQALAMLDAILCPEWEYRYHSFNSGWSPGAEMASMRNGSGDDWFLLLDAAGAALKGFAHELASDPALAHDIQNQVPATFSAFLQEPAFSMQNASFCYWREAGDASWSKVGSTLGEDGAQDLLAPLIAGPEGYQQWAQDYFEMPVPLDAVVAIFGHQPLADAVVLALNAEADLDFVHREAEEIGYPLAKGAC